MPRGVGGGAQDGNGGAVGGGLVGGAGGVGGGAQDGNGGGVQHPPLRLPPHATDGATHKRALLTLDGAWHIAVDAPKKNAGKNSGLDHYVLVPLRALESTHPLSLEGWVLQVLSNAVIVPPARVCLNTAGSHDAIDKLLEPAWPTDPKHPSASKPAVHYPGYDMIIFTQAHRPSAPHSTRQTNPSPTSPRPSPHAGGGGNRLRRPRRVHAELHQAPHRQR